MTPTDLYLQMGMNKRTCRSHKSDHMATRHAIRKVLHELDYGKSEIARVESNLTGVTVNHATIISSIKQDNYDIRRKLPEVRALADELGLSITIGATRVRMPEDVAVAPI